MDDAGIRRIVDHLRRAFGDGISIYLFGSEADGNARSESDIDLAVLDKRPLDAAELHRERVELELVLNRDVDLLDLRSVSTVMAARIVAFGRRVHTGDAGEAERFEMTALALNAELGDFRAPVIKAIRESGRIHGR